MFPIILITILTFSAIYAPQPLLPTIAADLGVDGDVAALLITAVFLPLAVAPLFYGYILESFSPRKLLRVAVALMGVSEVLFYFAPTFELLLAVRVFQGLLIPGILTSLMTYVSLVYKGDSVQRAMGIYIAATIFGGFIGRALSGLIATGLGWRFSFLFLAASFSIGFAALGRLRGEGRVNMARPELRTLARVFQHWHFWRVYLLVFCLFFVFAAVMNFLPFRLVEISPSADEFRIGMMYSGYLMGIMTALNAPALCRHLGGEPRAMRIGMAVYAVALLALAFPSIPTLFGFMFLFCGAMFLVHATASGFLNRYAEGNKGIVNGLYVAFYYGGGTLGSWLPGLVYRHSGWTPFLVVLAALAGVGLMLLVRLEKGGYRAEEGGG